MRGWVRQGREEGRVKSPRQVQSRGKELLPTGQRGQNKQEAPGGKKRLTYAPLCVGVRLRNDQESPFICPQRADGYGRRPALRRHDLESIRHPSASRAQARCQSWGTGTVHIPPRSSSSPRRHRQCPALAGQLHAVLTSV